MKYCLGLSLAVILVGCQPNMDHQAKNLPFSKSEFFSDHSSSRRTPNGTLAREQQIGAPTHPKQITAALLKRGQERYQIYCSVCHGRDGDGRGMAVLRGFPAPPSYHLERLRNVPVEHFYNVITSGFGVMYSYADRVSPDDRWAIAEYIRTLQFSQNAKFDELPTQDQEVLRRE